MYFLVALIQNDDSSSATDMLNYNCSIFPTNLNIIRFVPVEQSFQAKSKVFGNLYNT